MNGKTLFSILLVLSSSAQAFSAPFTITPPDELIFDGEETAQGTFTLLAVWDLDTNTNAGDPNNLCPECVTGTFPTHAATIGDHSGTHFVTDLLDPTQPIIMMLYSFDPGPPGDASDQFVTAVFTPSLTDMTLLLPTNRDAPFVTDPGSFVALIPKDFRESPLRFQLNGLDGSSALAGSVPALGPVAFDGPQFDFGTGVDGEPIIGSFFSDAAVLGAGDSQPHGVTNAVPEPSAFGLLVITGLYVLRCARRIR